MTSIAFINGNYLVNAKLLCRFCTQSISALRNDPYTYVHGSHKLADKKSNQPILNVSNLREKLAHWNTLKSWKKNILPVNKALDTLSVNVTVQKLICQKCTTRPHLIAKGYKSSSLIRKDHSELSVELIGARR